MVRFRLLPHTEPWISEIERRQASENELSKWQARIEEERKIAQSPNVAVLPNFGFVIEPVQVEHDPPRHVKIIYPEPIVAVENPNIA